MPLLSDRLMRLALIIVSVLVVITAALSFAGRWFGEQLALGGNTTSTERFTVTIGIDRLDLSANTIRLPEARRSGPTERADLYLTWPDLDGYSDANSAQFKSTANPGALVFLQLSQATMSRDMSGRLEPIYRSLFEGEPVDFGAGLLLHRFKGESGYAGEVMLTSMTSGSDTYAVRCILPAPDTPSTDADCQRDITIGNSLSVLYRFSSTLLPQWRTLDTAVRDYVESRLVNDSPSPAVQ
jgi:hypothetical protein